LPRRDVKPIVRDLMKKHKNLIGVFSAKQKALIQTKGLSENSATFFAVIRVLAQRLALGSVAEQPVLSDWERLLDYINSLYMGESVEILYVFFLDSRLRLIKSEKQYVGSVSHIPVCPKEILKEALDENASKVILVHNHPSGDSQPSADDIHTTKAIAKLLGYSDIELADHLIVGANRHVHSMRAQGILQPLHPKF